MPVKLALIRHGVTAWNREHRIQGRTDIPLDDTARADLARFALPAPWDAADLVASPLSRAKDTAEILARRPASTVPALLEMNWGDWEGQHGAALRADSGSGFRDIEHWGWDYRPPSGESPQELRARLLPWLDSLRADTLAVCHIGTMRVLLAMAWGWNFTGPCPFSIKRNRLYVMSKHPTGWQAAPDPIALSERLL